MSGTLREMLARAICRNPDMSADDLVRTPNGQSVPYWTEFVGDADAALAALRQWLADEGLVIVPAEPTPRMLAANSQCTSQELWAGIGWAAMIAAAPGSGLEDSEAP
jgi:hypothetical protein